MPYYPSYPYYQNPYINNYTPYNYSVSYQPLQTQTVPQTQIQQAMPQPQIPQQSGTFNWVKSERDVDLYYVAPNNVVTLWNENEPVVYMKQADATGKPTVRTFDLVERVQKPASEEKAPDYATKEELALFGNTLSSFSGVIKEMNDNMTTIKSELEAMKGDMYGIAGKKKAVRKAETELDE